jgi:hypothetical protein
LKLQKRKRGFPNLRRVDAKSGAFAQMGLAQEELRRAAARHYLAAIETS